MRLTLSHRSWALLAVCALSGCTTFDRPVASSRMTDAAREQRLQDDINRRIQAGDYEGAKQLLDQADRNKSAAPGRSHAKSDGPNSSGIQQVGYETTATSREEMIRELVKNQPAQRQAQEAKRYGEMPLSTLKQLYQNQKQAQTLGQSQVSQRDEILPATQSSNTNVEAPNPRGSGFGGTTPWPKPAAGDDPFANPVAATNPLGVPQPEPTAPTAAKLSVTDTGTRLSGIQTNDAPPSAGELPLINPATPGSTLLPVIAPRRSSVAASVATPSSTDSTQTAIEQVNGTIPTPASSVVATPTTAKGSAATNAKPTGPQTSATTNPTSGAPATLPGTVEPLQKQVTPPTSGIDRYKPKLPNPLPGGMQKINQTAKTAIDRTLGIGFAPALQSDPTVAVLPSSGESDQTLAVLIAQLESQLAALAPGEKDSDKLEYVRRNVNLRMLYLMTGQNDRAMEAIKGLDGDEQEFWQHLLWSIANYFDVHGLPRANDRATQTVAELRTATQKLKAQADLELRSVTFCQRIDSYGNFERLSRDQFPAGSAVLLYAEVENFACQPAEGDRQMTSLRSTIDFFKTGVSTEKPIQSIPFKVTQDYCRTKRRDFYLAFEFSIPQHLESGVYTLVLRTEDLIGKKVATSRINFSIE